MTGRVETVTIPVRYAETDRMGVVYHANYLVWMEIGRTSFLRAVGFPYHEIEAGGVMFAVSEVRCRFMGSAEYGDEVTVRTRVARLRSRSVTFHYDISVGDERVAEGETDLVAIDGDRRPRRIPADLAAAIGGG